FVKASPLTHVDLHSFIGDHFVEVDVDFLEVGAIPELSVIVLERPRGWTKGLEFVFGNPCGRVMAYRFGLITAGALDKAEIHDAHDRSLADIHTIGENQAIRIDLANCPDEGMHNLHI